MTQNNFSDLTLDERALLDAALPFIEQFLQEMGEFYPFAMVMGKNGVISSLKPDIGEEYPTSDYLIQLYEKTIKRAFLLNAFEYHDAIICINVIIHDKKDQDAVECRFLHKQGNLHKYYILYEIRDGAYIWAVIR